MKKFNVILFVLLALLILNPSSAYAKEVPASKTSQSMSVDGKAVDANAYLIEGNNYFKLRDVAALLKDTEAKFNVYYDQDADSVVIENKKTYEVIEGDLVPIDIQKAKAVTSGQKIILDGKVTDIKAYLINDNNYFKLRDLAKALNFGVDYNEEKEEIVVLSNEDYKEVEAREEKNDATSSKGSISFSKENLAGLSLNVLTIPNTTNIDFKVVRGQDSISGTEAFSSLIGRFNPKAAVNGNFFDAYKTMVPYGSIISNYELLKLIGNDPGFYITESGKRGVVDSAMTISVSTSAGKSFSIWYKNTPPNDSTGIYQFSPYYGSEVNVKGGHVVVVKNGQVTAVEKVNGRVVIPSDGYIIYLGPDAADEAYVSNMFQNGLSISTEISFKAPELKGEKVKEMVCAGPILLKDGVDVSAANKGGYEGKISNQNAQRSAIGVTKDGQVKIVTTKATTAKLAKAMKALGCESATNLDGGASSALYFNGRTITNPGRKLSTLLLIYEK